MKPACLPIFLIFITCILGLAACSPSSDRLDVSTSQPTATVALDASIPPTDPIETPTPEATVERVPILPIGTTADLTASDDSLGIEGMVTIISATEIVIEDFVFLADEAPAVDIRLGIGKDFSDDVALSLKVITGKIYQGRRLQLTIPVSAMGNEYDSIGIVCYDTGDVFDFAFFQSP
jgi:hypothetical protein